MRSDENQPQHPAADAPAPAPAPGGPPSVPPADASPDVPVPATAPRRRTWAWAAAALLAGLLAWAAGEATGEVFRLTPEEKEIGDASPQSGVDKAPFLAGMRRVTTRNSALHYTILGAALGATLGLAGGLARRSARGAALGGLVGCIAGISLAVLTSLAMVPVYLDRYDPQQPTLMLPLLVHGGIWAAIGVGAGIGLALGRGDGPAGLATIALGGVLGAVLGTVAFEVFFAIAFPLSATEVPVPGEATARLMALLIVSLAIALGAILAVTPPRPSASPSHG